MFAENLKFLREKYNIDQQELAEKLGRKSSSSISEWEKGKYTPKLKTLNEIAKIFNVDIDDLMNIDLSISNQIYNILPIYNQLNDENKVATYEFASNRLEEQKQENVLD
ncbi:helix-turn-helix transcriptional regulator, partial [Enterococcus faecium]|nr:helix-turn-helix transcriptional regulator [Enterococcus faecium]